MKRFLLLLIIATPFFVSARVVDLEDKEGRTIRADVISLQDGILSLRRTDSAALFRIPMDILSEASQKNLHVAMTEGVKPTLHVESIGSSRKSTTHWRTSWGEHSKTVNVERMFGIRVSSTSAFYKEVDVFVYWSVGGRLKYFVERGYAGGGEIVEIVTSESASERNTRYGYYYGRETYTEGDASMDMAVLVKDTDGNVLASWGTSRSVEVAARKSNDSVNQGQPRNERKAIARK